MLLLEKVQGEPLSEFAGRPLELPRFLSLAISLAPALAEIHSRNVIHKDIKPSNIILEPWGGTPHRLRGLHAPEGRAPGRSAQPFQRPFQGRDALEWFHAHMAQNPVPPHELNAQVPPAVSAIVMKLLAKIAEERYQSAEGLKADLDRCREGLSQRALEAFALGEHARPTSSSFPSGCTDAMPRSPPCCKASSGSSGAASRSCS